MVTHKYQVDHSRIFIEMDADEQPLEKNKKEFAAIDKLEREILQTQVALVIAAILCFSTATGMVVHRLRKNNL